MHCRLEKMHTLHEKKMQVFIQKQKNYKLKRKNVTQVYEKHSQVLKQSGLIDFRVKLIAYVSE